MSAAGDEEAHQSIAIVSVTAPWRRDRRCPGVQLAGDALSPDGSGVRTLHELQRDPFGVILDRGSHAHRAEGLQPDRAVAGSRRVAGPVASPATGQG